MTNLLLTLLEHGGQRARRAGGENKAEPAAPRDRITTRSPGNGGGVVGRYNGRFGQLSDRDPGVTPVQPQGYPSERSGVGRQPSTDRADFVRFGDTDGRPIKQKSNERNGLVGQRKTGGGTGARSLLGRSPLRYVPEEVFSMLIAEKSAAMALPKKCSVGR